MNIRYCIPALIALAAPGLLFPVNFNAPRAYSFGPGNDGDSLAVGDFNGDGKPDIAVVTVAGAAGGVEIFLGQGGGAFHYSATFTLPATPSIYARSIVAVDLNHDGTLDLAVATNTGVAVLLGIGDGTFGAAASYPAGTLSRSVVTGDFNKDGKLDLAVVNQSSNNVSVLLGNGDGTLQPAANYAVGSSPEYLVTGDFNGDGKLDLAVTNYISGANSTLSVLFGVGDGTFHPAGGHNAGKSPQSIAAGDFNGDGKPDLAIASSSGVSILLATGGGSFAPPVSINAGPTPLAIMAVDVNADGKMDLAVANGHQSNSTIGGYAVSVIRGNGDGTFQPPDSYYTAAGAISLAFADFNADGRLDLAVVSGGDGLSILPANNHGGFRQFAAVEVGGAPGSMVAADFNGDGNPDLAIANGTLVSILLGKGDGTFLPAVAYPLSTYSQSLATGDFNGDGHTDLALSIANTLWIMNGNGDGTFGAPINTAIPSGTLAAADFNLDGKADLATSVFSSFDLLLGNGAGGFQQLDYYAEYPNSLTIGDFNGDGKPDAVLPYTVCQDNYNCKTYTDVWLGNGDGSFRYIVNQGAGPLGWVAGDFNGDGYQDLAGPQLGDVWIRLSNGDGTLRQAKSYPADYVTNTVAAGDFNHDGKLDVAATGPSDLVAILLGNGNGTLQAPLQFIVGPCPGAMAVADFNRDGKPDIAVANGCSGQVTILTNTTP